MGRRSFTETDITRLAGKRDAMRIVASLCARIRPGSLKRNFEDGSEAVPVALRIVALDRRPAVHIEDDEVADVGAISTRFGRTTNLLAD